MVVLRYAKGGIDSISGVQIAGIDQKTKQWYLESPPIDIFHFPLTVNSDGCASCTLLFCQYDLAYALLFNSKKLYS